MVGDDAWLCQSDAQGILRCAFPTLRGLIARGELETRLEGSRLLVSKASVDRILKARVERAAQ